MKNGQNSEKIDVKKVAKLANIEIAEEKLPKFEKQLGDIVTYIEKLNEVDTKSLEPTAQVTGLVNVLREDSDPSPSLPQADALSNAKESHNGLFVVSQILEEK